MRISSRSGKMPMPDLPVLIEAKKEYEKLK